MCDGLMAGVFAYVVHAILADAWCECVRLLSVAAIYGLWRTFLRFGYMAHPKDDARKYGIYGGFTGLLQQVWGKWIAPGEKKLQLFISKVPPPYNKGSMSELRPGASVMYGRQEAGGCWYADGRCGRLFGMTVLRK